MLLERFQEADPASNPTEQEIKLVALATVRFVIRCIDVLDTFPAHPVARTLLPPLRQIPMCLLNAQLVGREIAISARVQQPALLRSCGSGGVVTDIAN